MKINGLLELQTTMRGLNKLKLKLCYIWLVIALGSIFKRLYELLNAAYVVNFHLGVRWLCAKNDLKWLRYTAGFIYVVCCSISWLWHIHWTFTTANLNMYHIFYLIIMGWIVYDDIILMQWLTS